MSSSSTSDASAHAYFPAGPGPTGVLQELVSTAVKNFPLTLLSAVSMRDKTQTVSQNSKSPSLAHLRICLYNSVCSRVKEGGSTPHDDRATCMRFIPAGSSLSELYVVGSIDRKYQKGGWLRDASHVVY